MKSNHAKIIFTQHVKYNAGVIYVRFTFFISLPISHMITAESLNSNYN